MKTADMACVIYRKFVKASLLRELLSSVCDDKFKARSTRVNMQSPYTVGDKTGTIFLIVEASG